MFHRSHKLLRGRKMAHMYFKPLSSKSLSPSLKYCLQSVQKYDYDNYWCSLHLPEHLRTAGIVLRAFNVEIATVQDRVTEKKIGDARFQFWEDTIDHIYEKKTPEHPVCEQLAKLIHSQKLTKLYFKRLITARRKFLKNPSFDMVQDVEDYAEFAKSPIYYLLLEYAGVKSVDADHAGSHLGKAEGLANTLRSIPYYASRSSVILPEDVLLEHAVSQEHVLREYSAVMMLRKGLRPPNLGYEERHRFQNVLFDICRKAMIHLDTVDTLLKKLNKDIRPVFLPSVTVFKYLDDLMSEDYNVFHSRFERRNYFIGLKLLFKKYML